MPGCGANRGSKGHAVNVARLVFPICPRTIPTLITGAVGC